MFTKPKSSQSSLKNHRIADKSRLFSKVIPALFVVLAFVMLALILFAAGVVIGLVPWA